MKVNNFSETTTADKVQVGDSTAGTSTSTNYKWIYPGYNSEKGWECPRCGRINAPWISHCDCSRNNWTITSDWTYRPEWWKEVTCSPDTFRIHPESGPIWKTPSSTCGSDSATVAKADPNSTIYTTAHTDVVGGSDYWNPITKKWENVSDNVSNLQKELDNLKLNFKIERVE